MVIIIIFVLLGFILGVMMDSSDWFLSVLKGISMAISFFIFGAVIAISLPVKTEVVKTTYKLEALQDNNSLNGSFFLGSGQIEGEMKYVFYYEKDGYYRLQQVDYDKVKIKYSDEKPRAERFNKIPIKDAFINLFAIDCDEYDEYVIYVPKGTIKQNFALDAQ